MSKSIIRAYTAWWPDADTTTRQEAQDQCVTELWTACYMRGEGFSEDDIYDDSFLEPILLEVSLEKLASILIEK